jgi:predicted MFS family arabinose efflux permease
MNFGAALVLVFLTHTAYAGSKLAVALYAIALGAPASTIGVLIALYSLAPALLALRAGRWIDRAGTRLPLAGGALGFGAAVALPWLTGGLAILFAATVAMGALFMVYVVAMQKLIGSLGEGAARTARFSRYALAVALAGIAGRGATGLSVDALGHPLTFLLLGLSPLVAAAGFALLPMARAARPAAAGADAPRAASGGAAELLRRPPLRRALIAAAVCEAANELFPFFLPIHAHAHGVSATWIGIILAAYSAAMFVTRMAIPLLLRRYDEETILLASLALAVAVYAVFPFVHSAEAMLVAAFLLGLGIGNGAPITMSLAYSRAPRERTGEALGLRQTVNKTIEVVVPIGFGALGGAAGPFAVFWANALLVAVGTAAMARERATATAKRPHPNLPP